MNTPGNTDLFNVFQWPEWKAFAERLGIPHIGPTTHVTIDLDVQQQAKVTQTYFGKIPPTYMGVLPNEGKPK